MTAPKNRSDRPLPIYLKNNVVQVIKNEVTPFGIIERQITPHDIITYITNTDVFMNVIIKEKITKFNPISSIFHATYNINQSKN